MVVSPESFNIADLWEAVADAVPDRTAIVCGSERRTFRQVDERASRLTSWMQGQGVRAGATVGLQMTNVCEHVEALLAAFKLRAIPVNINYRLTPQELRRIYDDASLTGVIHDAAFGPDVEAALTDFDAHWSLPVGQPYEAALRAREPAPRIGRSDHDPYVLYTGGTTGYPKGVEWGIADAFFACVGGGDPRGNLGPISAPAQITERIIDDAVFLPAPPLMHAAGMWTTLRWLLAGAKVVLVPTFDPIAIVHAIHAERVTNMNIVGDAMAIRLLGALGDNSEEAPASLRVIASGGAPLSPAVRRRLMDALPHIILRDSYGSSETGVHGWMQHDATETSSEGFATRDTIILDPETLQPIPPGSDAPGLVARRAHVPLRYRNDPDASARTFLTIGGERHAVTGDLGRLDVDRRLTLLGRGNTCINSGGEKVFPEEVESVLRQRSDIRDCLVLGVPDEIWGQRVAALVHLVDGATPDPAALISYCRRQLAGFKVPKIIELVDEVPRTAAGKPDYRAASRLIAGSSRGEAS